MHKEHVSVRFDGVLRTFARFFELEQIQYAVIDGLALQAWGYSRFTRDIDLVVERSAQDRVIGFCESLGYETLHVSDFHEELPGACAG